MLYASSALLIYSRGEEGRPWPRLLSNRSAFEKETGEKVLARSMGEWFKTNDRSLWGLIILTDKSFRYKYIPSESWVLSLFRRADKSAPKDKPVDIVVARENIASVATPKRDFFQRIFGPAFPHFTVTTRGESEDASYSFSADPAAGIIPALQKIVSARSDVGAPKAD